MHSENTYGLISSNDKKKLDNLDLLNSFLTDCNTCASVSNIPINKRLVFINISSNGTFSLSSLPDAGREIHCIINNTSSSDITVTIPNSGSYKSAIGTSLKIKGNSYGEINVISSETVGYIRGI